MDSIQIDGKTYDVVYTFAPDRAVINYDGLFVFADLVGSGWELSGVPARENEKEIFNKLVGPDKTEVIVTKS